MSIKLLILDQVPTINNLISKMSTFQTKISTCKEAVKEWPMHKRKIRLQKCMCERQYVALNLNLSIVKELKETVFMKFKCDDPVSLH